MPGQDFEDELERRRAARRGSAAAQTQAQADRTDEDELPHFSWSDTFAMIIAAYQVLMPMVLAMVGVMVAAYFVFKWIFA